MAGIPVGPPGDLRERTIMNRDLEIQSVIKNICMCISVVFLLFHLCYGVTVKGLTVHEAFLLDPVGYLTVFLPIVVSLVLMLKNAAQRGFSDKPYLHYLIATVATVAGVVLDFIVIMHYSMNTGWSVRVDAEFLKGFLLVLLIALIVTLFFTGFDLDAFGMAFATVALPCSLFILALVNGCVEANIQMQLSHEDSVITWILCSILFGVLYLFEVVFFLLISIPKMFL